MRTDEEQKKAALETPEDGTTEPDVRGTVFLTAVLLVLIFGFWMMMYLVLLQR